MPWRRWQSTRVASESETCLNLNLSPHFFILKACQHRQRRICALADRLEAQTCLQQELCHIRRMVSEIQLALTVKTWWQNVWAISVLVLPSNCVKVRAGLRLAKSLMQQCAPCLPSLTNTSMIFLTYKSGCRSKISLTYHSGGCTGIAVGQLFEFFRRRMLRSRRSCPRPSLHLQQSFPTCVFVHP